MSIIRQPRRQEPIVSFKMGIPQQLALRCGCLHDCSAHPAWRSRDFRCVEAAGSHACFIDGWPDRNCRRARARALSGVSHTRAGRYRRFHPVSRQGLRACAENPRRRRRTAEEYDAIECVHRELGGALPAQFPRAGSARRCARGARGAGLRLATGERGTPRHRLGSLTRAADRGSWRQGQRCRTSSRPQGESPLQARGVCLGADPRRLYSADPRGARDRKGSTVGRGANRPRRSRRSLLATHFENRHVNWGNSASGGRHPGEQVLLLCGARYLWAAALGGPRATRVRASRLCQRRHSRRLEIGPCRSLSESGHALHEWEERSRHLGDLRQAVAFATSVRPGRARARAQVPRRGCRRTARPASRRYIC